MNQYSAPSKSVRSAFGRINWFLQFSKHIKLAMYELDGESMINYSFIVQSKKH